MLYRISCATIITVLLAMASLVRGAEQELVDQGTEVQKLAGGFEFTEGPAADELGNVYFTDIPPSRIHKWSLDGHLSTFREDTGRANGLYFDKQGQLLACEGGNRRVTSIARDGELTVLTDSYMGQKYNSPNDLWIDPQGGVYFSDPRYGAEDDLEMDGFHVYYITPDRSRVERVLDNLMKPNGLIGTPDGRTLYVADADDSKTYKYAIQPDGSLTGGALFVAQGSDGMTLDEHGNLYLTGSGVHVFDPEGKAILTIEVPERPANVTFGGKDFTTLFITARTGLYALPMKVRGSGR